MMSSTARLAHYVIGPRFGFETPAITFANEGITTYGLSIGYQEPYAQYQPQLVEPPAGSDVLEDWRIFYELGRAMGLPLAWRGQPIDMANPPTTDALLEHFVRRSRVPLGRDQGASARAPVPRPAAAGRGARRRTGRSGCSSRTTRCWRAAAGRGASRHRAAAAAGARRTARRLALRPTAAVELLLVSRREHAIYNSVGHALPALRRRRPYNPAYLNPDDARRLGVSRTARS